MSTRQRLLEVLQENMGQFLSGEALAESLGVSRTSVWKAIKALKDQGYEIQAVTNRGYCLSGDSDLLSASAIQSGLSTDLWQIHYEPSVDSTNSRIRELAAAGKAEGYVLIAGEQTGGRGRMGRSFFSPADTGLYLSLLLRPGDFSPDQAMQLTTMAAAALCLAIEEVTGKQPGIKWVNDLFLNEKKICGILTEAGFNLETACLDYAVVGLGLNLYPPAEGFPSGLQDIASSLMDSAQPELKNRIVTGFLNHFSDYYQNQRFEEASEVYRSRSILKGKTVLVGDRQAQVVDITPRCQLLVRFPDDTEQALSYGEVQIVNL